MCLVEPARNLQWPLGCFDLSLPPSSLFLSASLSPIHEHTHLEKHFFIHQVIFHTSAIIFQSDIWFAPTFLFRVRCWSDITEKDPARHTGHAGYGTVGHVFTLIQFCTRKSSLLYNNLWGWGFVNISWKPWEPCWCFMKGLIFFNPKNNHYKK